MFPESPWEFLRRRRSLKSSSTASTRWVGRERERIALTQLPGTGAVVGSAFFYSREELRQDTVVCVCSVIHTKLSR